MRLIKRGLGLIALLGFNLAVYGDVGQDVLRCWAVGDNLERLTCYDRIARDIENSVAVSDLEREQPITAPEPEPEATVVEPTRDEPAAAKPDETVAEVNREEPVVVVIHAEPVPEANRETFGNEQVRTKAERAKRITATVVRVQKLSRGTHQLTFDDGQVWREIEYNVKTRYGVGDEVVIKRAFFGSYTLISQATGHANKVRRIK